jgi:AraC-like DNA-binding protein
LAPAAGTYTSTQSVTITSATIGASIRYTTDGSMPTESNGTLYSGPMFIGTTTTLNVIAYKAGYSDSNLTNATYTLNLPLVAATPIFSSAAGLHTVAISSATSGVSIRYTTDGSTPTETNGTLYSGPVNITTPITLKAIAYESGYSDSSVASAVIGIPTITITAPANGATIP